MSKAEKIVIGTLAMTLGIASGVVADLGFDCTAFALLCSAMGTLFLAPMFFDL